MKIQFNTDHNVSGGDRYSEYFSPIIESKLSRYDRYLTRIEVHLTDEDGKKHSQDEKKCVMEARVEHHQPVVVTNFADSHDKAIKGAVDKMKTALDKVVDKFKHH